MTMILHYDGGSPLTGINFTPSGSGSNVAKLRLFWDDYSGGSAVTAAGSELGDQWKPGVSGIYEIRASVHLLGAAGTGTTTLNVFAGVDAADGTGVNYELYLIGSGLTSHVSPPITVSGGTTLSLGANDRVAIFVQSTGPAAAAVCGVMPGNPSVKTTFASVTRVG